MSVIAAVIAVGLLIQLPAVQTRMADRVVRKLSQSMDADIHMEKIHFQPFKTLMLKNVVIIDREPVTDPLDSTHAPVDTFFRAGYIIAKFSLEGLLGKGGIHLNSVTISDAQMNLVLEDRKVPVDGDTTTDNLSRIFRLKKPQGKKEKSDKELFHIRHVAIDGMGFSMKDYDSSRIPYNGGINWNDLDIKGIQLTADDLKFKGGVMYGQAHHLSFSERSGFTAEDMSGKVQVGNGKTVIEDMSIKDGNSDLSLPLFMMSYENAKAFQDFMKKVKLDAKISESQLTLKTLSYFIPELEGKDLALAVSGNISGTVADFTVADLRFASGNDQVAGRVNGVVRGLPEVRNTSLDIALEGLRFTTQGISGIAGQFSKGAIIPEYIARGIGFDADVRAYGRFSHMNVSTQVRTTKGNADADVLIENILSGHTPLRISGSASTEGLDLRSMTGKLPIGPVTMRADASATFGEELQVNVDTLSIDRLNFNGYDYSGIKALGHLNKGVADGGLSVSDPNLNLFVRGTFSLSKKANRRLTLNGTVAHADLHALNLDKRGKSELAFRMNADVRTSQDGTTNGDLSLNDIRMYNEDGTHSVNSIIITPHISRGVHKLRLRSDFADAMYSGSAPVTEFIKDLSDLTARDQLPSLFSDPSFEWSGDNYELHLLTHNTSDILAFLAPGMFIHENTELMVAVKEDGRLDGSLVSNRIAKGNNYAKGIKAAVDNADSTLTADISIETIELAKITVSDNTLEVSARQDTLNVHLAYGGDSANRGNIFLTGNLERIEEKIRTGIDILPSSVYINGEKWSLPKSSIGLNGDTIEIDSFEINSGSQKIWADGKISEKTDTLAVGLERFDISILERLLKSDIGIKGKLTGNMHLLSPLESNEIFVDMLCDSTFLAGEPLGTLALGTRWNDDLMSYDISVSNDLEGMKNLDVNARFSPSSRYLNAEMDLDRLQIKHAEPFLKDVFSRMSGYASGKIVAEGPVNMLDISSEGTRLEDAGLTVAFTNVPYSADGAFHIDNTGVYFDDIALRDAYDGTGAVSGSINWDRFRDMEFNTRIRTSAIEAINIPKEGNEGFYGNLFATGNISITGPMNNILLSVDAVTAKTGSLHIPMTNAATASSTTNLLIFKEPEKEVEIDPYDLMRAEIAQKETKASDFNVNVRVNASPDVTVFVELDESGSNMLTGTGSGIIELEVGKDRFNINGDYTLSGGKYDFSALGIVNKTFEIIDGSNIHFNGDIMQSSLDIDAVYKCKATLSNLLSDLNSVDNRREVNCGIEITGRLSNPEIDFNIEVPDLNPIMQSRVESALNTDDKEQRQMLSLLLTNSFLPDEQSGIVNNSSMLYSNVTEAMANQLNNILHKLDIPLDLGLNYQPTEQGTDLFDFAVSTQLFNNRVILNGNIGNRQTTMGGTQNDVVGDVDLEIKINNPGTLRINLFSHSADAYSNYLDNTQRNGVGFTIQTEFNSLKKAIKDLFSKREKRKAAKLENEQRALNAENVTLEIKKEDYNKKDKDGGK